MSLFSRASAFLDRVQAASLNDADEGTFRYWRGAASVSLATVTVGQTPPGTNQGQGIQSVWQGIDLLVPVADLLLSGRAVEPEVGDKFEWTRDDALTTWQVQNADDGQCFQFSDDATQTMFRIHAKQVHL